MAPVVRALEREAGVTSLVCVTGQHRQMLDQVLDLFAVRADYDLNIMAQDQTLNGVLGKVATGLDEVIAHARADRVLVHGDTTTAMAAALAAFHRRIPIGHVEAGLRTYDLAKPWPEEMNRRVVDLTSDLMFAPTVGARDNLLQEKLGGRIVVTGNTVIDALMSTTALLDRNGALRRRVDAGLPVIAPDRRLVLVTGHRRESFGGGFRDICEALRRLAARGDVEIVYPVHLNPNVQGPVLEVLGDLPNIHLLLPQDYLPFVRLMQRADLVLTDSGGVQEEAPFLGKPVLVMRDVTERPEAVRAGAVRLVGTGADAIVRNVGQVLDGDDGAISWRKSPYGDGLASGRIVDAILGRGVSEFEAVDRAANDLAA